MKSTIFRLCAGLVIVVKVYWEVFVNGLELKYQED